MKKSLYITLLLAIAVSLCSCSTLSVRRSTEAISFKPDQIRLDLTMDDYELLGDIEVSVEYIVYYLPPFTRTVSVNGESYNNRSKEKLAIQGLGGLRNSGALAKAQYKIIETYPDADYVVPVYTKRSVENMFLGRSVNKSAKFKVYKFKR